MVLSIHLSNAPCVLSIYLCWYTNRASIYLSVCLSVLAYMSVYLLLYPSLWSVWSVYVCCVYPRSLCLRLIPLSLRLQGEESEAVQPVFAVCLQAERVPATVQDYREKLLHLRKLRHDLAQGCLPQGPPGTFQQVRSPPSPADGVTVATRPPSPPT